MVEQTSRAFDFANKSESFNLFHDYVIYKYAEQETSLKVVGYQFRHDTGGKLTAFLGKYSSYENLDEFTNWFKGRKVSQTEVMIKAKSGKATQIADADIITAIKAKVQTDKQYAGISVQRPVVSAINSKSWEDWFYVNDAYCFLGVIDVKPSAENPGNTWVNLKEGHDASGLVEDYSFSCKDEEVVGVVAGSLVLGRRNQLLPDRPFFFAGARAPVELVDWKELGIAGTAREFLERKQGNVHVGCECYFKDLLVVDNDTIYSGIEYSREKGEIWAGEECREGNVHQFLSECKQKCWMYLLDWGVDKGLFRLIAPKVESGMTTNVLISKVGNPVIRLSTEIPHPPELLSRVESGGNDGIVQGEDISVGGCVVPEEHVELSECGTGNDGPIVEGISDEDVDADDMGGGYAEWSPENFINTENGEAEFLTRFFNFVSATGFKFEPQDLIRFHTSVKCGFFTLLGGDPGTGKSSLALLYAKALAGAGYKNGGTYLRVDVNPGWIEPEDLLGFYSVTAQRFKESPTGIVSFLKEAQGAAGVRAVCFEELNLAHVEQYFSDFIQQLSRKDGDRFIKIEDFVDNKKVVNHIELKRNLRFIGTINFDETTHELSARFYDRCNYLELSPVKTEDLLTDHSGIDETLLGKGCTGDEIEINQMAKWVKHGEWCCIDKSVTDVIIEIAPILRDLHIAPSPRTLQCVLDYIASRPYYAKDKDGMATELKVTPQMMALDEAIAQRVLPVYRRPNDRKQKEQNRLLAYLRDKKLSLSEKFLAHVLDIEVPYHDGPNS